MLILLIAGASASGKSKLSGLILERLSRLGITNSRLGVDDYYYEIPEGVDLAEYKKNTNFDNPACLDFDLLFSHLMALEKGLVIQKPLFSFKTEKREGSENITPSDILLIDGTATLLFSEQYLSDFSNKYRIFIEVEQDIVLERRIIRDASERGYDIPGIIEKDRQYIRPTYLKHIEPTKQSADIIVNNNEKYDANNAQNTLHVYADKIVAIVKERLIL